MNLKMTVQYDGTRYDGWQRQGNTENTIQGRIENVLEKMTGEKREKKETVQGYCMTEEKMRKNLYLRKSKA